MSRILVHVEGETEESFVNDILSRHLYTKGYTYVSARIVGNARIRGRRGGIRPWCSVRSDILRHLKEDAGALSTTMIDYYALPQSEDRAWPGRKDAAALPYEKKAVTVEDAIFQNIRQGLGDDLRPNRFIPFVVMHEFEGLLFSDCAAFSRGIYRPDLEGAFKKIRDQFRTPEEINDSPTTAPSKRVEALVPNYRKPLLGILAMFEIGLESIRAECPHFDQWLTQLEKFPAQH